jgi:hypothetical protein
MAGDDRQGLVEDVAGGAHRPAVHHRRRHVELVLQLGLPLPAQGGRGEDQEPALSLGQELGHHDAGLDGLPQSDLVGQHAAAAGERLEGEGGGLDLVGVQVHPRLGEGAGEPFRRPPATERQLLRQQALVKARQRRLARRPRPGQLFPVDARHVPHPLSHGSVALAGARPGSDGVRRPERLSGC